MTGVPKSLADGRVPSENINSGLQVGTNCDDHKDWRRVTRRLRGEMFEGYHLAEPAAGGPYITGDHLDWFDAAQYVVRLKFAYRHFQGRYACITLFAMENGELSELGDEGLMDYFAKGGAARGVSGEIVYQRAINPQIKPNSHEPLVESGEPRIHCYESFESVEEFFLHISQDHGLGHGPVRSWWEENESQMYELL